MKSKKELKKTKGYWMEEYQNHLYYALKEFMNEKGFNQNELAEYLNCSKGYVSQILHGNFNHSIGKLIELSLTIGKAPKIEFVDLTDYCEEKEQVVLNLKAISVTGELVELSQAEGFINSDYTRYELEISHLYLKKNFLIPFHMGKKVNQRSTEEVKALPPLSFSLSNVKVEEFTYKDPESPLPDENDVVDFNIATQFGVNIEKLKNNAFLRFKVEMLVRDTKEIIATLKTSIFFSIEDLPLHVDLDKKLRIPRPKQAAFLSLLLGVSYSTVRGILVGKGGPLTSKYLLPVINPSEMAGQMMTLKRK